MATSVHVISPSINENGSDGYINCIQNNFDLDLREILKSQVPREAHFSDERVTVLFESGI